ncbi:Uncharacterized conserved protein, DUF58 family, contains vWF domain [Thermomonospora echinospora]|uniref:Uncharacterized conserved protein, DUF58 family, contains vWF domain n=1 Tax=Thermomonospora echinospora TaxID=1992 RepID=A0A1H5UYC2_9ACTN|nr:DUF58 domain-containing protein [Thermomonospora echinospora]SEF79408.1 Uncharacterized conserved protein, DUF58 family, contains vWF domain [Thermomonospora echinospora]
MRALAWLVCAAALAFAAGALPSLALFALAVGIVIMVAGAAVTVLVARARMTAGRVVMEREIPEDRPLRLRFDVRLPARLPACVHVRVGRRAWVRLGEGGGVVEVPIDRRGAYRVEASRLRVGDELGIFRVTVRVGEPERVLVLPVPDGGAPAAPARGPSAEHIEPDGLRPYVPGTPVSRIHWLSLARGMGLHERRMGPPPTGLPLVVVDTSADPDPRAVDWVARTAAGLVRRLSRDGGCAVLLPGDATATTVNDEKSWRALHRRLAVLDAGDGPVQQPAGVAGVVRFPPGHDLGPPPPPLPPGVVPANPGREEP